MHPFDCPANGLKAFTHLPGDNGNYDEVLDPDTGHRSGQQGGNRNEVGGFTSNSFMDPQALHHVHTLIFLTACFHVFFTVCEWLDLPGHSTRCKSTPRRASCLVSTDRDCGRCLTLRMNAARSGYDNGAVAH